jgi:protein XRP2
MFKIESCVGCKIYVHDQTAQVTIDLCEQSQIVMGPCQSSTFVRNCNDCTLVLVTGQLRLRDCNNLKIVLYC